MGKREEDGRRQMEAGLDDSLCRTKVPVVP